MTELPRTDPRLGRLVDHDPRSRTYDLVRTVGATIPSVPIDWHRNDADVFDQGSLGCCTACAGLGLMMTAPFNTSGHHYTLSDVHGFYHDETVLDDAPGTWPPTDTGSSGLAAMTVLRNRKLITSYQHAFSPTVALAALAHGPIAVGTVWLESMFEPRRGQLVVNRRSPIAGGHEYVIDGWDPKLRRARITNSWGLGFGDHGRVWLRYTDLTWLLAQQGDVVQPQL